MKLSEAQWRVLRQMADRAPAYVSPGRGWRTHESLVARGLAESKLQSGWLDPVHFGPMYEYRISGKGRELLAGVRCGVCGGVGWVLDYAGGGSLPPLHLELLPCLAPDCAKSGQPIEHLSLAAESAAFTRSVARGGVVMAVGR